MELTRSVNGFSFVSLDFVSVEFGSFDSVSLNPSSQRCFWTTLSKKGETTPDNEKQKRKKCQRTKMSE